ncbi:hypothetical protein BpHYR1_017976 [Brachionus plicatilis]|uniref:Uncharacterized protein n=1 Tax=Brachionus plicatilis TaxID=10195 RepID=A0A3M7R7F0_BRAPC|nr:hypothetical protein BpHYR1_017976 [Brachionus plicatilis]
MRTCMHESNLINQKFGYLDLWNGLIMTSDKINYKNEEDNENLDFDSESGSGNDSEKTTRKQNGKGFRISKSYMID